jgi:hypothetical protein
LLLFFSTSEVFFAHAFKIPTFFWSPFSGSQIKVF